MTPRAAIGARCSMLAAALLWTIHGPVQAQPAGEVDLGPTVRISAPGAENGAGWVYADPIDGRHLIVCGAESHPQLNAVYGSVYTSFDGGVTWRQTLLDTATKFNSEQSCIYGEGGHAY